MSTNDSREPAAAEEPHTGAGPVPGDQPAGEQPAAEPPAAQFPAPEYVAPQGEPQQPGTPPPAAAPSPPPAAEEATTGADSFFDSLRRSGIARTDERWIGGVAGGIANRLHVDPLIVRGALVVLTIFGGIGMVAYGLGWALLPEQRDGRIHLQEAFRGRFDAALAGAAVFFIVGISRPGFWWGSSWWDTGWIFGLALLGLIVTGIGIAIAVGQENERKAKAAAGQVPVTPTPAAPAPGQPGYAGPVVAEYSAPISNPSPHAWVSQLPPSQFPVTQTPAAHSAAAPTPVSPPPATAAPQAAYAAQGAPSAPQYTAPPAAIVPPKPPRPPAPPRPPRVPGPGGAMTRVALALVLLVVAGVLFANLRDRLDGDPWLIAGGAALVILGLGVLISGFRGRRSGALGALAVIMAILLVPISFAHLDGRPQTGEPWNNWDRWNWADWDETNATWTPSTPAEAAEGWAEFPTGEITVDLGDLVGVNVGEPIEVELETGQVVVNVPPDMALEIRSEVNGSVDADLGSGWTTDEGDHVDRGATSWTVWGGDELVLRSPEAATSDPIVLAIDAGLGSITIIEESR